MNHGQEMLQEHPTAPTGLETMAGAELSALKLTKMCGQINALVYNFQVIIT